MWFTKGMLSQPRDIAKYASALLVILGIAAAYVTGYRNTYSAMGLFGKNVATVSSALRFCNRPLVISLFALSYFFLCYVLATLPYGYALAALIFLSYSLMLTLIFIPGNCDCKTTNSIPCCGEERKSAGQCTHDDQVVNEEDSKDTVAYCNPPWCTKQVNEEMRQDHDFIAVIPMVCGVLFVWMSHYLYAGGWSSLRRRFSLVLCAAIFGTVLATGVLKKLKWYTPSYIAQAAGFPLLAMSIALL